MARSATHLGLVACAERNTTAWLQELGGWETADMVRRYAHISPEHLAKYAERIASVRVVESSGTNLAQAENELADQKGQIAVAHLQDWYRGSESNRHGVVTTRF